MVSRNRNHQKMPSITARILLLTTILIFSCLLVKMTESAETALPNDNDWWKHAVIYQIYPRSFMDSNDDGIGDLRGIIMKLPYLAETGITAIWLSPIFKSPMVDFGYDISDFKAIQSEYGTMDDFIDLINVANSLNIKILLDFVPNHTSDQHECFVKSSKREEGYEDFYIWADGKVNAEGGIEPPNNWQSVFHGSAWTWNEDRKQFYLHQFTVEQPDLNYRDPKVIEAMDEVLKFWLEIGVSGFRVDAVNHLFEDPDLKDEPLSGKTLDRFSYDYTKHVYTKNLPEVYKMVQHWRQLLDTFTETNGGPARIMMTEAYADQKALMEYYESTDGQLGAHFPFNFFFITNLDSSSDAHDFVYNIVRWLIYIPTKSNTDNEKHVPNWVIGNHDNPRVASRFGSQCVNLMNMLVMTLPGVAVTYNGEEIGMEDHRNISWEETLDPPALNAGPEKFSEFSRDPERTPFQWNNDKNAGFSKAEKTWLPVHPNYETLNLAKQVTDPKSHYNIYKELIELRKLPVLSTGNFQWEILSRDVFVVKRYLDGHPLLVTILNIGKSERKINLRSFLDTDQQLKVLIADSKSSLEKGQNIGSENFVLDGYQGLTQYKLRLKHSTQPIEANPSHGIKYQELSLLMANMVLKSSMTSCCHWTYIFPKDINLASCEAIVLQSKSGTGRIFSLKASRLSEERRALIKTLMKSLNVILIGLLMYKLWHNKWSKLSFNNYNK